MSDPKRTKRTRTAAPSAPPDKHQHIALRVDDETLARLDKIRDAMTPAAARLGVMLTQSDVLRSALGLGLVGLEKEYGLPVGPSTTSAAHDGRGKPRGRPRKPRL